MPMRCVIGEWFGDPGLTGNLRLVWKETSPDGAAKWLAPPGDVCLS